MLKIKILFFYSVLFFCTIKPAKPSFLNDGKPKRRMACDLDMGSDVIKACEDISQENNKLLTENFAKSFVRKIFLEFYYFYLKGKGVVIEGKNLTVDYFKRFYGKIRKT